MVDKIVTLDDDKEDCVLNELVYEDKKYCLALQYFSDIDDVGEDYFVFEEIVNGDDTSFKLVEDKDQFEYSVLKIGLENDETNNIQL